MKISFNLVEKSDLILLDDNYSNLNFKNLNYKTLDFKDLNFFCLILSIKKFFFSNNKNLTLKKIYKQTLLRLYQPKIVITHNLNARSYELKKLCPEILFIVYQFSFFSDLLIEKISRAYDILYLMHEKDRNFLKRKKKNIFKDKKVYIVGSVRNNERREAKKKKNIYDILYISQYTPASKYHTEAEKYIVKLIDEYCLKNNLKFNIALKFARRDKMYAKNKIDEEIKYFKNFLRSKIDYTSLDSLNLANLSKLIITCSSNFGLELLARKKKVLFLPFDENYDRVPKNYFLPKKNILNVHRSQNKKEIFNKIKKLIKISQLSWEKYLSKNKNILIKYDEGNTTLKKHIYEILKNYSKS